VANTERLIHAYVAALDLHAVYVFASSTDGPVLIGRTKSVADAITRIRTKSDSAVEQLAVRWCARDRDAKRIVDSSRTQLPQLAGGWLAIAAPIAVKAVEIVAADLGIMLETDAAIRERAEAAVRSVELELERMKWAGELRSVSRAYKEHRLARESYGRRAQSYGAWFANYKVGLVRTAAQTTAMIGRDPVSRQVASLST
jgi:hypothetical protein